MFYVDVILNNRVKARAVIDTGATYLSMYGIQQPARARAR